MPLARSASTMTRPTMQTGALTQAVLSPTSINLTGSASGETLNGSDAADQIDGGGGDDTIIGHGGNEISDSMT